MATSATIVGSTGLVGSHILSQLIAHPQTTTVASLTRRSPSQPIADPSNKLRVTVAPSNETWATELMGILASTSCRILLSGLGTTFTAAGSAEGRRKVDFDLNLTLAKAAKAAGVTTYVLISSAGANPSSLAGYTALKGELEEEVSALGFEKCVFLRPGVIVGDRESTRLLEAPLHSVAKWAGWLNPSLKNCWAQNAEAVARAAVRAALEDDLWARAQTKEGKNGGKVWIMGQVEIVKLGLEKE